MLATHALTFAEYLRELEQDNGKFPLVARFWKGTDARTANWLLFNYFGSIDCFQTWVPNKETTVGYWEMRIDNNRATKEVVRTARIVMFAFGQRPEVS
jgi:hypothetical protein